MFRRSHFFSLAISLSILGPAVGQQPASTNSLNDLLAMQMNWDASKSDDNAKPAVTLKSVPYDKQEQDGKTFTAYYVYATGIPTGQPFRLIKWQIGWDAKRPDFQLDQDGLFVNSRGVVMCRKPTKEEDVSDALDIESDARLNVIAAGSMGEPVRFALMSEKNEIVAMGRVVANPIQGEDGSCRLQAVLAVGGGEIMLVEGTGFPANTAVEVSRTSTGKPQTASFKTDNNGRVETAVMAAGKDEPRGNGTITMKSASCAPSVKVKWGRDTYKVQ